MDATVDGLKTQTFTAASAPTACDRLSFYAEIPIILWTVYGLLWGKHTVYTMHQWFIMIHYRGAGGFKV